MTRIVHFPFKLRIEIFAKEMYIREIKLGIEEKTCTT